MLIREKRTSVLVFQLKRIKILQKANIRQFLLHQTYGITEIEKWEVNICTNE